MVNVREYYEKNGEALPGKKVRWLFFLLWFFPPSHFFPEIGFLSF